MHHAVSGVVVTCIFMNRIGAKGPRAQCQMIDKIWYDWQLRNPVNADSFFGGSVEALQSQATYNQYPNGGPPYLGVSTCHFR